MITVIIMIVKWISFIFLFINSTEFIFFREATDNAYGFFRYDKVGIFWVNSVNFLILLLIIKTAFLIRKVMLLLWFIWGYVYVCIKQINILSVIDWLTFPHHCKYVSEFAFPQRHFFCLTRLHDTTHISRGDDVSHYQNNRIFYYYWLI